MKISAATMPNLVTLYDFIHRNHIPEIKLCCDKIENQKMTLSVRVNNVDGDNKLIFNLQNEEHFTEESLVFCLPDNNNDTIVTYITNGNWLCRNQDLLNKTYIEAVDNTCRRIYEKHYKILEEECKASLHKIVKAIISEN